MRQKFCYLIVISCLFSCSLFAGGGGGKAKKDKGKATDVELVHPEINNPNRYFVVLKPIDMTVLKGDKGCRHVSILLLLELNNEKNKEFFKGKLLQIQSTYREFLMRSLSSLTKISEAKDYIAQRLKDQSKAYFGEGVVKDIIIRKIVVRVV